MIKSVQINDLVTFTANGVGTFSLNKVSGLATPVYRTTSITFAGRNGGMVPDQKYGQRLVTIEGSIESTSPSDLLTARALLLQALSFNVNVPVLVTTDDDKTYLFYAKFQQPQLDIDAKNSTDLQLIAIANDWRLYESSGTGNSVTVLKLVNGGARWLGGGDGAGWRWLAGSGLRWTAGAGSVNAHNSGNTASSPTITITGANQNPVIRNNTTGEQIKVNITTGASDVITIDGELHATMLNGGNINALVDPGSTYFDLNPGDNLLTLTNDNSSGGQALVEWFDAVTGV